MSNKHKKASSLLVSKNDKSQLDKRLLKSSMVEINHINSLIGKHSTKWSFSKAIRFTSKDPEPSSDYLLLKTTIGQGRKAGFGLGKRWTPLNPRGKDAPPSTKYTIPSSFNEKKIGGKISPARSHKGVSNPNTPGPGAYNLKTFIGEGRSCTLKSRHKMLARHSTPPPGTYNPVHSLVESGRYSCISFGAKTSTDNLGRFSTPGPGTYELISTFSSISPSPSPKRRITRKNSL